MRTVIGLLGLSLLMWMATTGCEDDPPDELLSVTVVDRILAAGAYRTCWDQLDNNGDPVPARGYSVWVESGNGWDTSMLFHIYSEAVHVPSPGCDSVNVKKGVPEHYGARLNDSVFAPGDSIMIDFDVPTEDSITVRIHELGPI